MWRARALSKARNAQKVCNWHRAAALFRRVLRGVPDRAPLWVQLGHCLKEDGQLRQAESAYLRSLSIAPDVADTHIQLGHVLKMQNRRTEAHALYRRAAMLDPANPDVMRELGGTDMIWTGFADPAVRCHGDVRLVDGGVEISGGACISYASTKPMVQVCLLAHAAGGRAVLRVDAVVTQVLDLLSPLPVPVQTHLALPVMGGVVHVSCAADDHTDRPIACTLLGITGAEAMV